MWIYILSMVAYIAIELWPITLQDMLNKNSNGKTCEWTEMRELWVNWRVQDEVEFKKK